MEKPNILVLDDCSHIRKLISSILSQDFTPYDTDSVGEAMSLTKKIHFNLLIIDLFMPNKNGDDVLQDLRASGVTAPALVLTAANEERITTNIQKFQDIIPKPFNIEVLLTKVNAALQTQPKLAQQHQITRLR